MTDVPTYAEQICEHVQEQPREVPKIGRAEEIEREVPEISTPQIHGRHGTTSEVVEEESVEVLLQREIEQEIEIPRYTENRLIQPLQRQRKRVVDKIAPSSRSRSSEGSVVSAESHTTTPQDTDAPHAPTPPSSVSTPLPIIMVSSDWLPNYAMADPLLGSGSSSFVNTAWGGDHRCDDPREDDLPGEETTTAGTKPAC